MFAALFRYLESRIDVFAPFDERETPPHGVWPFMWHHIKGVKGWMALIMLTGLVTGYRTLRGRSAVQGFSVALAADEALVPTAERRRRAFAETDRASQ